ncbi:MAG TPA: VanZ family protein [Burkholderiales bacterium]|nr:VanZ family protein [Burkholderiales bacterium]
MIVYASLSPFSGWRDPGVDAFEFLFAPWPRYVPRFDVALNVFAYVPLGFLLTLGLAPRTRWPASAAVVACVLLSLAMEGLQTYLPGRISSNIDLLANTCGGLAGALLAARAGAAPAIRRIARARARLFLPGGRIDFGIALLVAWFVSQLNPSLPLLGIVFFSEGVQAQLAGYTAAHSPRLLGSASVVLTLTSVGLLTMALMRSKGRAVGAIAALVAVAAAIKLGAAMLLLKREAIFLWVSQEVVAALGLGLVLIGAATLASRRVLAGCLAASLLASIAVSWLRPDEPSSFSALRLFDWSYGQLLHFTGLASAVADVWPVAALGYVVVLVLHGFGEH